jgi:hypothetical protein
MKKLLLVTFILTLAAFAFAALPRSVFWQIDSEFVDILDYVDTAQGEHDADFQLDVVASSEPDLTVSTTTHSANICSVFQADQGGGMMAWAKTDQQAWVDNWPTGTTLTFTLTYIPTGETATNSVDTPSGTSAIYLLDAFDTDPGTWWLPEAMFGAVVDEILSIQTDPVGAAIYVNGVDSGQVAPWDFLNPTPGDVYTVYIDGTYTWDPVDYTVPVDFTTTTVNFVGTQAPPDTWTYNLYVTGPDGYAVTGPSVDLDGVTDYMVTADNAADLLGDYTIEAAPAGWHWVVNPITVVEADFVQVAPVKSGLKNSGAKEDYVYEATIEFVLEEDVVPDTWTYILNVNGPDGYAVTGPVGGTTDYVATDADDEVNDLVGDYTIEAAPAGWHWVMNPITVVADDFVLQTKEDFVYIATIEFVLEEDVIEPDFTFFVEAHDITDPTGPDINAEILFNGMPYDPPIYTPYTFEYYANDPGMTTWQPGFYMVYDECYINWVPESIEFVYINTDYEVDFLGENEPPTPVELSSFTATATVQNTVQINWVTQSEHQMNGFLVYRNSSSDQSNSVLISNLIPATNTSTTQTYSITDSEVETNNTYYYWLEAVDYSNSSFHGPVSVIVEGNVPPVLPETTTMRSAYPNPFKLGTSTNIEVQLKAGDTGSITIYNVLGQVVKTVSVSEGLHTITWNGKDSRGNDCGSGIYFYKLSTPSVNMTKKMVIVK